MDLPLSEEERDCLQEVCNISMGAAAEALAEATRHFVALPIPKIRFHPSEAINDSLECLSGEGLISAAVQSFTLFGIEALALVVVGDDGFTSIAEELRGQSSEDDTAQLLANLSEVLDDVCLPVLAEQLNQPYPNMSEPESICLHQPLAVFEVTQLPIEGAVLTVEINYRLEESNFNCDLVLIFPNSSVDKLKDTFSALLD